MTMAATFTADQGDGQGKYASGPRMIATGTLNLGTYATGGVAVTQGLFSLNTPLLDLSVDPAKGGYVFAWDKPNGKVMAFNSAGAAGPLAEVANGFDLSTVPTRCRAESKG
jgi:hypothetical protein